MRVKSYLHNNLSTSALRIIKNSYSLIVSQLLRYLINIFISVWIVRYLGAELFGAFSYINALTGIFGIFSSLGLQSIIIRELVKTPEESKTLLGTSMFLSFIAGLVAYISLTITVIALNTGDRLLLFLALINGCAFLFDTLKFFSYHYESLVQSDKVAKINNITIIIVSVLKVVCLYLDLGIYVLSSLFILEAAISGFMLFFLFSRNVYSPFKLLFSKRLAKKLLKAAFPLIISGFMISLYSKIDQVMIKNLLGNKEAGIFAVAVRLTELFYFIPVIIWSSFFPGIVAAKIDAELFRKKINNLYSILIIFSYAVIIVISIFSEFIIVTLYGSEFLEAQVPLIVLIWALLFVSLGIARNAFIFAQDFTKYYMYITIIGAILNIVCNTMLIPRYGIIGAPVSSILSSLITTYVSSLFFKPLHPEFYAASRALIWPKIDFKLL